MVTVFNFKKKQQRISTVVVAKKFQLEKNNSIFPNSTGTIPFPKITKNKQKIIKNY